MTSCLRSVCVPGVALVAVIMLLWGCASATEVSLHEVAGGQGPPAHGIDRSSELLPELPAPLDEHKAAANETSNDSGHLEALPLLFLTAATRLSVLFFDAMAQKAGGWRPMIAWLGADMMARCLTTKLLLDLVHVWKQYRQSDKEYEIWVVLAADAVFFVAALLRLVPVIFSAYAARKQVVAECNLAVASTTAAKSPSVRCTLPPALANQLLALGAADATVWEASRRMVQQTSFFRGSTSFALPVLLGTFVREALNYQPTFWLRMPEKLIPVVRDVSAPFEWGLWLAWALIPLTAGLADRPHVGARPARGWLLVGWYARLLLFPMAAGVLTFCERDEVECHDAIWPALVFPAFVVAPLWYDGDSWVASLPSSFGFWPSLAQLLSALLTTYLSAALMSWWYGIFAGTLFRCLTGPIAIFRLCVLVGSVTLRRASKRAHWRSVAQDWDGAVSRAGQILHLHGVLAFVWLGTFYPHMRSLVTLAHVLTGHRGDAAVKLLDARLIRTRVIVAQRQAIFPDDEELLPLHVDIASRGRVLESNERTDRSQPPSYGIRSLALVDKRASPPSGFVRAMVGADADTLTSLSTHLYAATDALMDNPYPVTPYRRARRASGRAARKRVLAVLHGGWLAVSRRAPVAALALNPAVCPMHVSRVGVLYQLLASVLPLSAPHVVCLVMGLRLLSFAQPHAAAAAAVATGYWLATASQDVLDEDVAARTRDYAGEPSPVPPQLQHKGAMAEDGAVDAWLRASTVYARPLSDRWVRRLPLPSGWEQLVLGPTGIVAHAALGLQPWMVVSDLSGDGLEGLYLAMGSPLGAAPVDTWRGGAAPSVEGGDMAATAATVGSSTRYPTEEDFRRVLDDLDEAAAEVAFRFVPALPAAPPNRRVVWTAVHGSVNALPPLYSLPDASLRAAALELLGHPTGDAASAVLGHIYGDAPVPPPAAVGSTVPLSSTTAALHAWHNRWRRVLAAACRRHSVPAATTEIVCRLPLVGYYPTARLAVDAFCGRGLLWRRCSTGVPLERRAWRRQRRFR
eukprot:TRINITY_DN2118_c0_g1_i3.p1 TRINITY_DN2118_c0_g1~~TRINITY_DN2118_c0_g1_i3.p1  ORF type:complete len:1142 (-),score=166.94 TRINITY_DN2118_c0_g1_i3:550-3633(-)